MKEKIKTLVGKTREKRDLESWEIKELLAVQPLSEESFYLQAHARQMSEECCDHQAEIHAQVGVNSGPCPCDCAFCSFAVSNKIFKTQHLETTEDILEKCLNLKHAGANAIYLMATANFSFQKYLQIGKRINAELDKDLPLIANVGDFGVEEARALKKAGFSGIYHAVRLGEGKVTGLDVKKRLATFAAARAGGLLLGTCVEPVGPEHDMDEIIEKIILAREAKPVFSGAARRIPLPGTPLADYGMISEVKMAHLLAVVRLATGVAVKGNCTHEPNVIGAAAGANLLWAEAGANPRDVVSNTEKCRGYDVARCKAVFAEAEWQVLSGASRLFTA